jgi:hypothetical protein
MILVKKHLGKWILARMKRRWRDNIKIIFSVDEWEMDSK